MTKKTCLFHLFLFFVAITTIYFVNSFVVADEVLEFIKLKGHLDRVFSAAFSSNGKMVVTASDDRTARIWDATMGKELKKIEGHTYWVKSAAFSPDGKTVVTASLDKTARIWDAATGKELKKLEGHARGVNSAVFSPDGKTVVTASDDDTARIWDAATGKELRKLEGHTSGVSSAMFSPDSKTIVTASSDKTARIWDTATGRELKKIEGHTELVGSAAFSPDGKTVVTASDDRTARIWDTATGRELKKLEGHTASVISAAFSPDSKMIVTASHDRTARIWDAATGKESLKLEEHIADVASAVFSPDGKTVLTASYDKTALIKNLDKTRQRKEEKERKAKEYASHVSLTNYLKEAGFESKDDLWNLAQYGTADLQSKFKNADEFDKAALKKQIMIKQNEIKDKKFVLTLPYTTTALKVDDTNSRVELIVQLPLFVSKIETDSKLPEPVRAGIAFRRGGDLITDNVQVFTTEIGGEYNANTDRYWTNSSFLTKDGKIRMCDIWEVTEILNNNGVVYWEETYFSILHILVSDKTETIKKLVRQKENYNVEVRFANLFWGRPKSHGWFEHQALKKFKSTESLRKMQEFLNLKKDADDPAKNQPVYFITKIGDNVDEGVIADIIDVQIIEKK